MLFVFIAYQSLNDGRRRNQTTTKFSVPFVYAVIGMYGSDCGRCYAHVCLFGFFVRTAHAYDDWMIFDVFFTKISSSRSLSHSRFLSLSFTMYFFCVHKANWFCIISLFPSVSKSVCGFLFIYSAVSNVRDEKDKKEKTIAMESRLNVIVSWSSKCNIIVI